MNWNRYDKEVTQVGTRVDNKYQIGSYITIAKGKMKILKLHVKK